MNKPIANGLMDHTLPQGYELQDSDVGTILSIGEGFGRVQPIDVGKRVWCYRWILTIESNKQRDARKETGPEVPCEGCNRPSRDHAPHHRTCTVNAVCKQCRDESDARLDKEHLTQADIEKRLAAAHRLNGIWTKRVRVWLCECGHMFIAEVKLSRTTANLTGEETVWCPSCGKRPTIGTPVLLQSQDIQE